MADFAVWAPAAERVRVTVGRSPESTNEHPMTRGPGGWWHATVGDAGPGWDYAYLLDDDDTPLPDPRSPWQPNGVHDPSRLYDHTAYRWNDGAWTGRSLPGSVLYELHVGTFTQEGTFDSAIARLDHLISLGVDLVEVMPVNALEGPRNWGYDGVCWYAVQDAYGGPDAFKRFVDACHARGLGVVLDVVHNHLGHSGAYLPRFGPYFSGRNLWGPALNLDGPDSDEVRRYVIDNVVGWLRDYHLDGLRLDAVHALVDHRAIHLLEEMAAAVDALSAHVRRPLTLIAESDLNDPRLVTPRAAGGYGLAAQWCDDIHHCLHATLTGERQGYYGDFGSLAALATTLRGAYLHAGTYSSFRRRTHGRPVDRSATPGHRFLAYLQNHDQIGNRAEGDRMSASVSPGLLACGAAIVLCSPFTPMIFMGEEWGASTPFQFFSSFFDADLREKIRLGRFEEFADHGWGPADVPDPSDVKTFERSKLDWSEPDNGWHAALLSTYRSLIALRRAHPELTDPRLDRVHVDYSESERWLVLHRGPLRLAVNLSPSPASVPLGSDVSGVLHSSGPVQFAEGAALLAPESFALVALA
jgi:maltooligosyltrehalose trehalohydrolase